MVRRDLALQGTLVLTLICGIVGGNFLLHRWVIGDAASREAGAGINLSDRSPEDLDEFAPRSRTASQSAIPSDPTNQRELLRKLIAEKLPTAIAAVREAWLEELSDVSLTVAAGILDLRGQVGAFPEIDETAPPRTSPVQIPELNFTIDASR